MSGPRPGYMRHRLTFQARTTTQNAYGEEAVTPWQDQFTVWGSIEPLRGQEYMDAQQQQADVSHRVRIRYRDGVVPTMRIEHKLDSRAARYLEVVSVIEPFIRGTDMQLMCREAVEQ